MAHRANLEHIRTTGLAAIVGREAELDALRRFLAAPSPARLLLQGPAGIGKTTVWGAGVDQARADGHRILVTRPLEAEAASAFTGLTDLIGCLFDEAADELPPPQKAALGAALLRTAPTGQEAGPGAVSAGALSLLRAAARDGGVLIAVDDLQWLDGPTAATLRFALRRLESAPVRLLATARTDGDGRAEAIGEDMSRLPLGPLGLDELAWLVPRELGRPLPRPVLRQVERMAGGNAFLALELARSAMAGVSPEVWADRATGRGAVGRLAADRLATLPAPTIDALAAVAALSNPTTAAVASAVPDDSRLDPAFDAGAIAEEGGQVRFAHPLLAAAALARLTPRRRRLLHVRLAQLVDDAEGRARHLAAATVEPDATVAETLDAGAADALARGAPAAAAELCEHAARLTPARALEARGARLLQAGRHHREAGDSRRALELFRQAVDELPHGPRHAEALVAVASHEQTAGRQGLELGRRALEECGDDREVRARCLLEFGSGRLTMSGDWRSARRRVQEALALIDPAREPEVQAYALATAGMLDTVLVPGGGLEALREACKLERQGVVLSPYDSATTWIGMSHQWKDEVSLARPLLSAARERAQAEGNEAALSVLSDHLCDLECRAGNLERALEHARVSQVISEQGENDQDLAGTLAALARVSAERGDEEATRRYAARGLAVCEAIDEQLVAPWLQCIVGCFEVALGNAEAAVEQLGPLPGRLEQIGIREPGCMLCHADLIEALIGTGRYAEADERLASWESLGREIDRPRILCTAARARGMLRAERGDLEGGMDQLEHALELHARLAVPVERGRTLLALGVVQRRVKQRRAARESFDAAEVIFDAVGASVWARRARTERARVSGRSARERDQLTPAERQIAELVAAGRTNREVARELFVTVRTVEANLTRTYSKLGIRSRAELAALRRF